MVETNVEPWLRGTLKEIGAVPRGVLHALELAAEDVTKWCGELSDLEINQRPFGLPSVAFQLRHIARSLDRLLTYAEANQLTGEQIAALKSEMDAGAIRDLVFSEFTRALETSAARVKALAATDPDQTRGVGRRLLLTTVGGLLVHVADHTQRHVGQAITTAKVLLAMRQA